MSVREEMFKLFPWLRAEHHDDLAKWVEAQLARQSSETIDRAKKAAVVFDERNSLLAENAALKAQLAEAWHTAEEHRKGADSAEDKALEFHRQSAEQSEAVRGLREAFGRMQEFHDCMEAQRKDEPLPEGHDYPDEACGDGVCYRVGDIIKAGIAASRATPAPAKSAEPKEFDGEGCRHVDGICAKVGFPGHVKPEDF